MNKTSLIIILCILGLIWGGLSARNADSLYIKLHKKAEANLKYMPSYAKKSYKKLLNKYPDRLMAFLLAYEEGGTLCAADPAIVENHYKSVKGLMQEQGITQPDEFFLSYVAKITVSDEAITNYRKQFEDSMVLSEDSLLTLLNLKDYRQAEDDPLELYRQACLKTTEWLVYKPTSGRDQSPLDVVYKSLYGRCEESEILFAALCRTLGIPARAASTPWWAHQDDNHAWVEVYLDGAWHYSGDSDGGYWPDQTWFTGLANKMVIITADSSLPAPDDEVLSKSGYGAVVNSIKYYAGENTRTLNLKVVDAEGRPVDKCPLLIDVYNFYSLRPQAYTLTDEQGEKILTVGKGAFFIMAAKDTLQALQFIPSNSDREMEYTLELSAGDLPEIHALMKYPGNKTKFKDAPQEWKDEVKLAKDKWQKQSDFFKNQAEHAYPPEDSLLNQVLQKARLNSPAFSKFISHYAFNESHGQHKDPLFDEWLKVLLQNDEKDLWQGSPELFNRMYEWFKYMCPRAKSLPEEEMLNLFDPTVFYENLPWMSYLTKPGKDQDMLYPRKMRLEKTLNPDPNNVIKYFDKKHKNKPEKAMNGLVPLDLALSRKNLTSYQYKILACAYLRANGIPANYTRVPDLVSVYTDSTWKYFDLKKNAYYEADAGEEKDYRQVDFSFTDELNQPAQLKPEQVNICFLNEGQFYSASQQPDYLGNGRFEAKVPMKGMFYVQIGYRNSDSLTVYNLLPLTNNGKPVERIDLELEHFRQKWLAAEDFLAPVTAELDQLGYEYAVLGSFTRENCLRMAAKLKAEGVNYIFGGFEDALVESFNYMRLPSLESLLKDVPSLQNRTITLAKNGKTGKWQMYEGLWEKLP